MKHVNFTLFVLFAVLNLVFYRQIESVIPVTDNDLRFLFYLIACLLVSIGFLWSMSDGKKKFTACCSMDIYNALSELGFTSPYMTCPLPSDVNYNKLMANPKEYRYVILDANSGSGFTVDDIERAILQSKTVNIIIRFDESTYSGMDIKWMQHAFKQAGVPVCSTLQLFNLLTKYYGKN